MQVTKFLVDDSEVGEWTLQVFNSLVIMCIMLLLTMYQGVTASEVSTVLLIKVLSTAVASCCRKAAVEKFRLFAQLGMLLADCMQPLLGLSRAATPGLCLSADTEM